MTILSAVNAPLTDTTLVMLNVLNIGVDDGRRIESGMVYKMNNSYFKYELKRSNSSMFTCRNLNWFERFVYRIKGYKVIKLN